MCKNLFYVVQQNFIVSINSRFHALSSFCDLSRLVSIWLDIGDVNSEVDANVTGGCKKDVFTNKIYNVKRTILSSRWLWRMWNVTVGIPKELLTYPYKISLAITWTLQMETVRANILSSRTSWLADWASSTSNLRRCCNPDKYSRLDSDWNTISTHCSIFTLNLS